MCSRDIEGLVPEATGGLADNIATLHSGGEYSRRKLTSGKQIFQGEEDYGEKSWSRYNVRK